MSQPEPPTTDQTDQAPPPPTGGAAALAAAAARTRAVRATRHVPTAKVPKASGAGGEQPQGAQEPPNDPPKGDDAEKGKGSAQEVNQAPPRAPAGEPPKQEGRQGGGGVRVNPAGPAKAPETATGKNDGGSQNAGDTTVGTEIILPPPPPNFSRLFQPAAKPAMDPMMFRVYTDAQVKVAKSLRSIMDMFLQRWQEYSDVLAKAREEGYPEEEVQRIAIQYNVDAPPQPGEPG